MLNMLLLLGVTCTLPHIVPAACCLGCVLRRYSNVSRATLSNSSGEPAAANLARTIEARVAKVSVNWTRGYPDIS